MRSKAILEHADFVVLIHDGKSKGTSNELKMIEKMGIPYKYYQLDPLSDFDLDIEQLFD
jgi:uncharacterized phage-like protein YoqJ